MVRVSELDPRLLNPTQDSLVFNATLDAHGTYSTDKFVLRMSTRVHELVDALTRGETDGYGSAEVFQAYSTYRPVLAIPQPRCERLLMPRVVISATEADPDGGASCWP